MVSFPFSPFTLCSNHCYSSQIYTVATSSALPPMSCFLPPAVWVSCRKSPECTNARELMSTEQSRHWETEAGECPPLSSTAQVSSSKVHSMQLLRWCYLGSSLVPHSVDPSGPHHFLLFFCPLVSFCLSGHFLR